MSSEAFLSALLSGGEEVADLLALDPHEPPMDAGAVARTTGVTGLVARAILLDALKGRQDFLSDAQQPGTLTLIRVPDADWTEEIALAWRLLVDPLAADEVMSNITGDESGTEDRELIPGRRRLSRVRRRTAVRPHRMEAVQTKVPAGQDKRLGAMNAVASAEVVEIPAMAGV